MAMATAGWQIEGRYYENCSCDYVCPCVLTQMQGKPTQGACTFAMGFKIERGRFGELPLDGLGFIVVGFTPEEMAKGNWSVGLIVDERATEAQRDAIIGIASGSAGGPMAALGGLVGKLLGAESAPILFQGDGASWSVLAADKIRIEGKGAKGINPERPPLQLSNTGHPAADTFSLANASNSHVALLGVAWDDTSGRNNAQYAPFSWRSA
jgi:hypothetical protein